MVQVKTGHTHVLNGLGLVELHEDRAYLVEQVGPHSAGIVLFKKPFNLKPLCRKSTIHITL